MLLGGICGNAVLQGRTQGADVKSGWGTRLRPSGGPAVCKGEKWPESDSSNDGNVRSEALRRQMAREFEMACVLAQQARRGHQQWAFAELSNGVAHLRLKLRSL